MTLLSDNVYNSRQGREQKKVKLWRYCGLMVTYKCNGRCEFCYYHCGPEKGGKIDVETAVGAWEGIVNLSADRTKIHITGGEPFLYFDLIARIAEEVKKMSLPGFDSIETNGYWAENDKIVRERIGFLHNMGLNKLAVGWDPFHAEFVDVSKVRRLVDISRGILGKDKVLVRWEKYIQNPCQMADICDMDNLDDKIAMLKEDRCRFTGRASGRLSEPFRTKSIDQIAEYNCRNAFLHSGGVHIDPYGNVFNGQCSGIITGNVKNQSIDTLWKLFDPCSHEFFETLFYRGPVGLAEEAGKFGFDLSGKWAGKCHLCSEVRQFFFDRNLHSRIIGPNDCYEKSSLNCDGEYSCE